MSTQRDLIPPSQTALIWAVTAVFGTGLMATRPADDIKFNLGMWGEAGATVAKRAASTARVLAGMAPLDGVSPYSSTTYVIPLPVQGAQVSSPFGPRKSTTEGMSTNHEGVDLALPCGKPVLATLDGEVITAGAVRGYGNVVYVRDGNSEHRYGHLLASTVQQGQAVKTGQLIGYVGDTGVSTGCHLHWEIREAGVPVDPLSLREKSLAKAESELPVDSNSVLTEAEWLRYEDRLAELESSGGRYNQNRFCYLGRWQMGAGWLEQAGLVDRNRLAHAQATKHRVRNWQCVFLLNPANWNAGYNAQSFIADVPRQRAALRSVTERNLRRGYALGALTSRSSRADVFAWGYGSHLLGTGCESKRPSMCHYHRNGTVGRDANGTAITKYIHAGRAAANGNL